MRVLSERRDSHRESLARCESQSGRCRNPSSAVDGVMPVLRAHADASRDRPLCRVAQRRSRKERAGVMASRREFLKGGGALIVSFSSAAAWVDAAFAQGPFATQDQRVAQQLDSWLAIGADGRVTAYTGKCELGQGIYTAQTQLVAEELSVPVGRVTLIQCDISRTPDQGTTSGSQSTPTNFNEANLAQACATAREALLRLGAERLGVSADQLTVVDGVVGVQGDASRWVGYGELVGGKTFNLTVSSTAKRRPAEQWRVLGTGTGRVDLPAMATGRFEYVHNVRVPGMLHGRVVRPPAVGATVVSVDESSLA